MQAPSLSCVLHVNIERRGWHKMLTKIFQDITGLAFSIDLPNGLMYLHGEVDPLIFIKKLYKARAYAMLYRIDYGYEENPEGTRKPNSHFMRCRFELNILEERCYKKIIGALKTIQGVSFTIDAPTHMGYLCGNIETRVLMKMLEKTRIGLLTIDYGVEYKDANLKPPPKKPDEAPTETKPAKDTMPPPPPPPPPPEVVSTSTHHHGKYKKSKGFRMLCF